VAIAMSNSLNPAENCPSKAESKLFAAAAAARRPFLNVENSVLRKYDELKRAEIIADRMSQLIIIRPQASVFESNEASSLSPPPPPAPLIRTRFKSVDNYLWSICAYFDEPAEAFYVRSLLELGRVTVGHRIFIDKPEQVIIRFRFIYCI
jgi:hypothetical protein